MSRWLVWFAVLGLVTIGVIWFLSAYDRVPAREWVGPTGEARRNPYLAAERFAARMGVPARQLRSLPELDTLTAGNALFMPNRRQALDPRRVREIAAWVDAGGHLIAEAELMGVADPLFELLGVQRQSAPRPPKPAPGEFAGRKLTVSIFAPMTLEFPGGKEPARFVTFRHGKGRVSAAASFHFARNGLIGSNDNAEFLWELLQLAPSAELQVYLRPERLSLWGFLHQHAAPVLSTAAALLVLWLWRIAPRFGPVRPDAAPARRRLLDHLRASGRYYWARGLRAPLVSAARDAALRRIARAQPDFPAAPAAERLARVAALAGIEREEAERFMRAGADSIRITRGADFIRIMHTAHRIHSALEKGNR
jgi:hypothetical protein